MGGKPSPWRTTKGSSRSFGRTPIYPRSPCSRGMSKARLTSCARVPDTRRTDATGSCLRACSALAHLSAIICLKMSSRKLSLRSTRGAARLYGAVTRGIELDALVPGLATAISAVRQAMGDAAFVSSCDAGAALSYQAAGELARGLIQHARDELRGSQSP